MTTLNAPMIDYLTATTWEQHVWAEARHGWLSFQLPAHNERRMQYGGQRYGNVFFGIGMQRGKPHYMMQASGEDADHAFSTLDVERFNCTRIDLQVTMPCLTGYYSRALYDALEDASWIGRKRQLAIVQSGDGYDTIYVGNRKSDRFTRIYVKPTDSAGDVIRFEVEYKAAHAHSIFRHLTEEPNDIGDILAQELADMPSDDEIGTLRHFFTICGETPMKPKIKRVTGQNSTLDWLRTQVDPAVKRLLNSHEWGDATRDLVESWYTYGHNDTI
jgi:hypothetical protein